MAKPAWLGPRSGRTGGRAQPPSVADAINAAASCPPGRAKLVSGDNCPGPGPDGPVQRFTGRARNVSTESTGHRFGKPNAQRPSTSG